MLFNQGQFLVFMPLFLILYYLFPQKAQKTVLILGCIYFVFCQGLIALCAIFLTTILTFFFSRIVNKNRNLLKQLSYGMIIILVCMLVLCRLRFFTPLGMSFYLLRIIAYVIDVKKGQDPELRLDNIFLIVAFFPILPAGPIERRENLIRQMAFPKYWNPQRAYYGGIILLIGYSMKYIIADRLAVIVDKVFMDYLTYSGSICLLIAFVYSVQIYCDFAGYSYIAIGLCELMGVSITENFTRPYFSLTIKEFWRRWHISLSQWLRDYIYIPLGGNKKGVIRQYISILVTFMISGFWHGSGSHFIVWGLLHGFYQIIENCFQKAKMYFGLTNTPKFLKSIVVFLCVVFAWIFFRAPTTGDAYNFVMHICNEFRIGDLGSQILNLGWGRMQIVGLLISIVILFVIEWLIERGSLSLTKFFLYPLWIRTMICYGLMIEIVICLVQCYGMQQKANFIYAGF